MQVELLDKQDSGGALSDFYDLPAPVLADAGKVPVVNVGGTGFEYATPVGTLTDGDYGDITVSGSGTVLSIDAGAVTLAKQANVASGSLFYRKSGGAGAPEVQTLATLKTDLGLTGTNSGDQTSIVGITGSLAEFNAALTGADFATGGGTATGTNTGDQDLSGLLVKASNLSDLTNAGTARTNLGLAIGSDVQAFDQQLSDLAALSYAGNANKVVRVNAAANAFELVTLAGGGDLLAANNLSDVANTTTARTNLGAVGTARAINTTAPITGGGDLSADRTIGISAATTAAAGSMSAADKTKLDNDLAPVHMTADAAARGAAIADYFATTLSLEASSTYEIECHAHFLKTTAGTVTWTWTFSSAPTMATSRSEATPTTGYTGATITGAPVQAQATSKGQATMAHAASGSLTTAVDHSFIFWVRVRTNAATTVQLRSTESAGTITPRAGSYMRARKIA